MTEQLKLAHVILHEMPGTPVILFGEPVHPLGSKEPLRILYEEPVNSSRTKEPLVYSSGVLQSRRYQFML